MAVLDEGVAQKVREASYSILLCVQWDTYKAQDLQTVVPRVHSADLHSMQLFQRQLPCVQVCHHTVWTLSQV